MTQPIHPMLFAMADAMLEAIRKEHVYVNCVDGDPAHTIIDGGTFDFTVAASAAVHALMEPTPDMLSAASWSTAYGDFTQEDAAEAMREMLRPLVEGEGE